jgi:hypothetical protein
MADPLVTTVLKIRDCGHDEFWLRDIIYDNPSVLGLGDLQAVMKEKSQSQGGRLDLLLKDSEDSMYEVEVQLGETDESHIIRTIEYWDNEKRRWPNRAHTAVLVAEKITSRFFNVVQLLSRAVPIIGIQANIVHVGDVNALHFATVIDSYEEPEEIGPPPPPTDRPYWEQRATKDTVHLADRLLEFIRTFEPKADLNYNKFYIGLTVGNRANNFASFVPQKTVVRLEVKLPQTEETDKLLQDSGLDLMSYDRQFHNYRLRLAPEDIDGNRPLLTDLMKRAWEGRVN